MVPFESKKKIDAIENFEVNYSHDNYKYIINNNVGQYSSYIVVDDKSIEYEKTIQTIIVLLKLNYENVKNFGPKENFICLLNFVSTENEKRMFEIEVFEMPLMLNKYSVKFIFKLKYDLSNFKNLSVAVIWKPDYNKKLNLSRFISEFNETIPKKVVLPYNLIKFQIPTILQTFNPRIPSVGLCVHYTYAIPSFILNWIDNNLIFGIREIMLYDATDHEILRKTVSKHFSDNKKIIVRPYDMTLDGLCDEKYLLKQFQEFNLPPKIKKYFKESCKTFFKAYFKEKHEMRTQHEPLTVNDCFVVLKEKYEFIAHYDLDEFIFPRTFNNFNDFYKKNVSLACTKSAEICHLNVFENSYKTKKSDGTNNNFFYNYINSIIDNNSNGRNLDKLSSIYFQHAGYLIPNNDEKNFVKQMRLFINLDAKTKNKSSMYPFHLYLTAPPFRFTRAFSIDSMEDAAYVKYLYKTYQNFISCGFKNYLNNTKIDKVFIRYFYFIAGENERGKKAVHYYKNVNSIFIHHALDYKIGHWILRPTDAINGQYFSHHRQDMHFIYSRQLTGSIKSLNIDFEYMFFMLKKSANYCNNYL